MCIAKQGHQFLSFQSRILEVFLLTCVTFIFAKLCREIRCTICDCLDGMAAGLKESDPTASPSSRPATARPSASRSGIKPSCALFRTKYDPLGFNGSRSERRRRNSKVSNKSSSKLCIKGYKSSSMRKSPVQLSINLSSNQPCSSLP